MQGSLGTRSWSRLSPGDNRKVSKSWKMMFVCLPHFFGGSSRSQIIFGSTVPLGTTGYLAEGPWMSMVIIQSVQGVDHLRTFSGEGRILRPRPSCWLRMLGLRRIAPHFSDTFLYSLQGLVIQWWLPGISQGRSTRFAAFNATRHQGLAPGGLKGTPKLVESLVQPVPVALVAARWGGPGGDLFIFNHEGHRLLLGSIQDVWSRLWCLCHRLSETICGGNRNIWLIWLPKVGNPKLSCWVVGTILSQVARSVFCEIWRYQYPPPTNRLVRWVRIVHPCPEPQALIKHGLEHPEFVDFPSYKCYKPPSIGAFPLPPLIPG